MILVTGSTGLLGSHVVAELLLRGKIVRALYRTEARKEIVRHVLQHYFPDRAEILYAQIEWFEGDVLDLQELEDAMTGCEKVVHCAALVSFHRRDFWKLFEANRKGTANVVNTALDTGITQLIHVSSTAAIGSDSAINDGIRRESDHWNANEKSSGYSLSKYSAEKEVWRGMEEGLRAVIVNPSVMFGPGDWNDSSLKIFRTLSDGLAWYTPGGNAFVDVRDVALVIARLEEEEVTGERFLVTGRNMPFRELFEKIAGQLKVKAPHRMAGPFLTGLAWRISGLKARLTGTRPTITKESAESSQRTTRYSSEKITDRLQGFSFRAIEDTIANTIQGRLKR